MAGSGETNDKGPETRDLMEGGQESIAAGPWALVPRSVVFGLRSLIFRFRSMIFFQGDLPGAETMGAMMVPQEQGALVIEPGHEGNEEPMSSKDVTDATFATDNFLAGQLIGQWAAATLGDSAADARIAFLNLTPAQPTVDVVAMKDIRYSSLLKAATISWPRAWPPRRSGCCTSRSISTSCSSACVTTARTRAPLEGTRGARRPSARTSAATCRSRC